MESNFPQRLARTDFAQRLRTFAVFGNGIAIAALALSLAWVASTNPRSTVVAVDANGNTVPLTQFDFRNLLVTNGMVSNFVADWYTGYHTLRYSTYRQDTQRLSMWLEESIRSSFYTARNGKDKDGRTMEQQLIAGQITSSFILTGMDIRRDDATGDFIVDVEGIRQIRVGSGKNNRSEDRVRDRFYVAKPIYNRGDTLNPYGLKITKIVNIPLT